jgi:hypothetical protein
VNDYTSVAKPSTVSTVRYYFDTEFMEDGTVIELLSIGIVAEDGRELYAISSEANVEHANEWVRENVLPHLHDGRAMRTRKQIRDDIVELVGNDGHPQFWAYFADYDWIVMCQLFGTMMDLPFAWPQFCMDVKQWAVQLGNPTLPKQDSVKHNALNDAHWVRKTWESLYTYATKDIE